MTVTCPVARGLRNRNPGNLRHVPSNAWQGEIEPDAGGYCRFDTDHHGLRACALDVLTKWRRGLTSVRQIIAVYAPVSENPTERYVAAVAGALGVDPDQALALDAPAELAGLLRAIVRQECGTVPYAADELIAASAAALAAAHPRAAAPFPGGRHG